MQDKECNSHVLFMATETLSHEGRPLLKLQATEKITNTLITFISKFSIQLQKTMSCQQKSLWKRYQVISMNVYIYHISTHGLHTNRNNAYIPDIKETKVIIQQDVNAQSSVVSCVYTQEKENTTQLGKKVHATNEHSLACMYVHVCTRKLNYCQE